MKYIDFYNIPYSTLSSPPSKRPTFSKIHEGTRQRWFFIFKILKLFTSFCNFLQFFYQKSNWRVVCLLRHRIINISQTENCSNNCYYNDSGPNYNFSYPCFPWDSFLKILFQIRMVVVAIATRNSDLRSFNYI